MSTTIATPDADETCDYCGSRIFDHDPICVRDCDDDCGSPSYFCNYACLSAYVDENDLTTGDACEWSPGESGCCCETERHPAVRPDSVSPVPR